MTPVRVLIADDHAPTREEIAALLADDPRFEVAASARDAPEAIQAALRERPDLCLLDVHMPGNGISAIWEITARLPEARVVVLTISSDDRDLFAAVRAGAAGYLLKDMDAARLPHALFDVFNGEAALPRGLVARMLEEFRDRSPHRRSVVGSGPGGELTSREWQVLDLMRLGLTTAEMARRLHLSQATVRSHVAGILRKLRVPDRDAAIALFPPR